MAWTAPRTWVVGEVVTAAIMNTHVRDNLNSIRNRDLNIHHGAAWQVGALTVNSANQVYTGWVPGAVDFNSAGGVEWRQIHSCNISALNACTALNWASVRFRVNDNSNFGADGGTTLENWNGVPLTTGWKWRDSGWALGGFAGAWMFQPGYRFEFTTGAPTVAFGGGVLFVRNT